MKKHLERLQESNTALQSALEGWMLDHGHRCRICTERSQRAIKVAGEQVGQSDE